MSMDESELQRLFTESQSASICDAVVARGSALDGEDELLGGCGYVMRDPRGVLDWAWRLFDTHLRAGTDARGLSALDAVFAALERRQTDELSRLHARLRDSAVLARAEEGARSLHLRREAVLRALRRAVAVAWFARISGTQQQQCSRRTAAAGTLLVDRLVAAAHVWPDGGYPPARGVSDVIDIFGSDAPDALVQALALYWLHAHAAAVFTQQFMAECGMPTASAELVAALVELDTGRDVRKAWPHLQRAAATNFRIAGTTVDLGTDILRALSELSPDFAAHFLVRLQPQDIDVNDQTQARMHVLLSAGAVQSAFWVYRASAVEGSGNNKQRLLGELFTECIARCVEDESARRDLLSLPLNAEELGILEAKLRESNQPATSELLTALFLLRGDVDGATDVAKNDVQLSLIATNLRMALPGGLASARPPPPAPAQTVAAMDVGVAYTATASLPQQQSTPGRTLGSGRKLPTLRPFAVSPAAAIIAPESRPQPIAIPMQMQEEEEEEEKEKEEKEEGDESKWKGKEPAATESEEEGRHGRGRRAAAVAAETGFRMQLRSATKAPRPTPSSRNARSTRDRRAK